MNGVAAAIEHEILLKQIQFSTIIDIGANKGQFALVCRYCFPDAKIISFEPIEEPSKKFRMIFLHDSNVVLHQVAIGPETAEKDIHISARDDSSSLLSISELQNEIFPGTAEVSTQLIKVVTLNNLIKPNDIKSPALLKIDVQGYELESLKGCEDLLNCFQNVYVECSFVELYEGQSFAQDVIVFLDQHGFVLKGIYNMSYDKKGNAVQADFFFANSNI
jgi:FkbM family methyltransferase